MNQEQIEKFVDYFLTLWPQAATWDAGSWAYWSDVLKAHGPSYVRIAINQLIRNPTFDRFPPGLAAMIVALDEAEAPTRRKLRYVEEALARDTEAEDEERVAMGREAVERLTQRLAE
jgi:hypothetical protein